jgi:hypothetical protein
MNLDDFDQDLLEGFAQLLQVEGVGTYRPTAGYAVSETGIYLEGTPDTASRVIQLTTYSVDEHPAYGSDVIGLQVITRWENANPFPCRRLDTQIFNRLQGRASFTLPTGIRVETCSRRSGASLGMDSSKRWGRSSNYYLRVHRPTLYRL